MSLEGWERWGQVLELGGQNYLIESCCSVQKSMFAICIVQNFEDSLLLKCIEFKLFERVFPRTRKSHPFNPEYKSMEISKTGYGVENEMCEFS